MRYVVIIAVLCLALVSTETFTLQPSDTFELDARTYTLNASYEDAAVLSYNGSNTIFRIDDCVYSASELVCLTQADNVSADFERFMRESELEITRNLVSSARVGQTVLNELELYNSGELPLELVVVDTLSNGNIISLDGYNESLFWSGVLDVGKTRTLGYELLVSNTRDIEILTNISGDVNASDDALISVDDILTVDVSYVENPSVGVEYNFTVSVSGSTGNQPEVDIVLRVPHQMNITGTDGFRQNDDVFATSALLNTSHELSVTYTPKQVHDDEFILELVTDQNTTITRRYNYSYVTQESLPIQITHNLSSETVVNSNPNITFVFSNPNNQTISTDITFASVLLSEQITRDLQANTVTRISYPLITNTTGEFSIAVTAEFSDENNDVMRTRYFAPISVIQAPPRIPNPRISIVGPQTISNTSERLNLSVHDVSSQPGLLTWYREDEVIRSQQIAVTTNDTYQLTIIDPGTYRAVLEVNDTQLTADYVVASTLVFEDEEQQEEEAVDDSDPSYLLFSLVLLVAIGGGVLVWRVRQTIIATHEYQEVLAMQPHNAQEARLREELLSRLRDKTNKK